MLKCNSKLTDKVKFSLQMEDGRYTTAFSYSREQGNDIIVNQALLDGDEQDLRKKYFKLT